MHGKDGGSVYLIFEPDKGEPDIILHPSLLPLNLFMIRVLILNTLQYRPEGINHGFHEMLCCLILDGAKRGEIGLRNSY